MSTVSTKMMQAAAGAGGGKDYIWALEGNTYGAYVYLLSPDLNSVEAVYTLPITYQVAYVQGGASCCGDANGSVWFVVYNSNYERFAARMTLAGDFHVDTSVNLSVSGVCSNDTTVFYHGYYKDYIRTYAYNTATLQSQGTNHTISGLAGGYRVMTYCADKDVLLVGGNNTSSTDYIYSIDWSGTPSLLSSYQIFNGGFIEGDYYNALEAGGTSTSSKWCANQQYNNDRDLQFTVPTTTSIQYAGVLVSHFEYAYTGFQILSKTGYGISGSFYADSGDDTVLYKFSNNGNISVAHNTYYNALTPAGITMNAGSYDSAASPVNGCFYINGNLGTGSYNGSGKDIFRLSVNTSNDTLVWDTSTTEEMGNTWQSRAGGGELTICHSSPSTARQTGL